MSWGSETGWTCTPCAAPTSHLVEDGFDALFVQQQVGHEHAWTTSLYTCVSSDYRTAMLRQALDKTLSAAAALEHRS